jgi:hypothetical protein
MTLVSTEAVPEIGLGGKGLPIISGKFQVHYRNFLDFVPFIWPSLWNAHEFLPKLICRS